MTDPDAGDGPDLVALERTVRAATRAGDERGLGVLGHGEITLVLGTPPEAPRWACKRLPAFDSPAAAATYGAQFDRYLRVLAARGVTPVASELRAVGDPAGRGPVTAYVVQPALAPADLGPAVLAAAPPDPDHPVVTGIVDAVLATCDDRTGLDAQLSNWSWDGTALSYLDVSTPMLFDARGDLELDMDLFLAAYPWALRGVIGHLVAPGVVRAYRDPRRVLVDLAANLHKERLAEWVPEVVVAANRALGPSGDRITTDEVGAYYRSDARLWEAMLRLRRADRWWQRRVRRRAYPFLLPGEVAR